MTREQMIDEAVRRCCRKWPYLVLTATLRRDGGGVYAWFVKMVRGQFKKVARGPR